MQNKFDEIEKEKKHQKEVNNYENKRLDYINQKWNEKKKDKWRMFWILLAWGIAFVILYFIFPNIDDKSKFSFFKQTPSFVTFIISTALSIFLNREKAVFSFKYWFCRKSIERKYKNEFKETFEIKNSFPILL